MNQTELDDVADAICEVLSHWVERGSPPLHRHAYLNAARAAMAASHIPFTTEQLDRLQFGKILHRRP